MARTKKKDRVRERPVYIARLCSGCENENTHARREFESVDAMLEFLRHRVEHIGDKVIEITRRSW